MVKILFHFFLRYFVSGVCLFVYYTCLLFVYFGCAGFVGIFSGGPGHIYIYFVCETPLCGVPGRYTFSGRYTGVDGGAVRVFSLLFCCSGYGTVEMVRGVFCLSFCFLQFAVSSPGGWMFVVGFLCSIN